MPLIVYEGQDYVLHDKETVLDGLLRHGVNAAFSCRSGACQACMMRASKGSPPTAAQHGLKDTLKAQGYFLACQCIPAEDLEIGAVHVEVPAKVTGKNRLNESVMRLSLSPLSLFDFHAGQYLQLVRHDGIIRSYSIASLPGEDIELHIERVPNGMMSSWVFDELMANDEVQIRGPVGDCFYVPGNPHQPLLLVGTATGLAPLYGILRDALQHQHSGKIHIIHGSTSAERLYYRNELTALSQQMANVQYQPCVLHGESGDGITVGDIQELVLGLTASFKDWRVYLCGNPELVFALRKKIFMKGASMKDIFSDAFLHTKPAK